MAAHVGFFLLMLLLIVRLFIFFGEELRVCKPDELQLPEAAFAVQPLDLHLQERIDAGQPAWFVYTDPPAWFLLFGVFFFGMPVLAAAALLYAHRLQRLKPAAMQVDQGGPDSGAEESQRDELVDAGTRRRLNNLHELNRSWWQTVRLIAGCNLVVGSFCSFAFTFQVVALQRIYDDPDGNEGLAKVIEAFSCAACLSLWTSLQVTRFVLLRSICAKGRGGGAGARFVAWTSQLESGVLAALLCKAQGAESIGKATQVARDGSGKCRAVHLSKIGPNAFRPGGDWSVTDSFPCARPDFFISHSWRDDPDDKYEALKLIADRFEKEHGHEPALWIDKYCIEQQNISASLRYLPVYLTACDMVVIFMGPTCKPLPAPVNPRTCDFSRATCGLRQI